MGSQVLQGTLVLPDRLVEKGQLVIEGGIIADLVTDDSRYAPTSDYGDDYISPGLIDLHVHGIAGADIMEPSNEALELMARRFAAHGVTGYLASTLTASSAQLEHVVTEIAKFLDTEPQDGARILGIHLEGPWISRQYKGVQNAEYIVPPDLEVVRQLVELSGGAVRRISLAPEIAGAEQVIRWLREKGIFVSIAHTGATYEEALRAVDLGATHVTHCFNAMTPLHHRHPGVAGAAMLVDDLYTELIADGVHIHPAVMRLLIRVKGRDRVALVTDAMAATELADGVYELGGMEVFVRSGEARLANGQLASSTLTMDAAVRNTMHMCGVSLVDAVYMASTTPARAMDLGDSRGMLRVGCDADLAILDGNLQARGVYMSGRVQYPE